MTYDPPPHEPTPERESMWPGFAMGLLAVAPLLYVLSMFSGGGLTGPLLVMAGVGSFIALFQRNALIRGIGAGVLTAMALALLVLIGACFQYLNESS